MFSEFMESGLRIVSSIVLARILFPEDFGLMGLASIAIQFARRLMNFGMTSVLVQLKEVKDDHYNTVFWMNIIFMSIVAAIVFFSANYYANFFQRPELVWILRVVAFDFIFKALASVPSAILRRNIRFKELAFSHTIYKLASVITAIALAVSGYGVWSLVIGELVGSWVQRTAVIRYAFRFSDWKPKFRFKIWAVKDTYSFGLWLYINTYITYGINKVDYFFIGKFLGTAALGFYERAFDLMSLPRKRLVRKINRVAFSTYSRLQDDDDRLIRGLLRVTSHLSVITYPVMIWLFFAAPALIIVLYGAKWAMTVLPLQIMCASGLVDSFTLIFQPLLKAKGYIGNSTRRDLIYLVILSACVLGGIYYFGSIAGVAMGIVAASLFRLALMMHLTIRKMPLTIWQFIAAQRSAMVYGLIQLVALLLLKYFSKPYFAEDSLVMLIAVTTLSAASFFGGHLVFRFEDINDIFQGFSGDLKKVARKMPVIKRLGFLQSES